jgi:rSAM/selenodomain-associated transferase 2
VAAALLKAGAAPALAVIVPTLNEADALPRLLAALARQREIALELIVADGGSTDDTAARARAAGAQVVVAAPGRGRQMNAGARAATAPTLLFLHADSGLTADDQLARGLRTLQDAGAQRVAGHFALRFERTQPGFERLFAFMQAKTRTSRPYSINGDQGLLLPRAWFDALGGFDETLPFLEDQRLAARIFASGRWLLLPGELTTSARRFEREGHRERYTLMALLMAMHAAQVDEFFARAPAVYRAQHEAQRLDLAAFTDLIRAILWDRRWHGTARTLYRVGGFVRENAWQLALLRDLDGRHLPGYDRWVAPLLANPAADTLAALLASAWFYGVLPLRLRKPYRSSATH